MNTTTSLNISLPEKMKRLVKERVTEDNFGTPSDYIRHLIREDAKKRDAVRQLEHALLQGIDSGYEEMTLQELEERAQRRIEKAKKQSV